MNVELQAAHSWFTNLDRLIKHVNSGTNEHGVHLLYSTPSCYLKGIPIIQCMMIFEIIKMYACIHKLRQCIQMKHFSSIATR